MQLCYLALFKRPYKVNEHTQKKSQCFISTQVLLYLNKYYSVVKLQLTSERRKTRRRRGEQKSRREFV